MKCGKAQRLISARIDGELAEASAGTLREHLEGCPDCRVLSEGFTGLAISLDVAGPPEPRFGFTDRLMRRIDAEARPAPVPRRRLGWLRPAQIGLGVFAFGFGVWTTMLTYGETNGEATTSRPSIGQVAAGMIGTSVEESFETTLAGLLPEWEMDR